jgi:hypothetical protein
MEHLGDITSILVLVFLLCERVGDAAIRVL